jgi:dihydroflavonol-4-reductase
MPVYCLSFQFTMKVVVFGATGHIGNATVRELLSRGYEVTATSRRREPAANLVDLPVRYACGDSDTPGQLEEWISGHDVVIDAAAPYPLYLSSTTNEAEQRPLEYAAQRTHSLLDAVRKQQARLVYVSSFTTLSRQRPGIERWQSQLSRFLHPYFAVKEFIETQIITAARAGIPIVIVNPTACIGPWDLRERELCFIPRLLRGEVSVGAQHVVNIIDVRDVALAVALALATEQYGKPLLLSGHNLSIEALCSQICEIGGVQQPRFLVPAALSLLSSYVAELTLAVLGQRSPLPSLFAMLACEYEGVESHAVQRILGVTPRPLAETLRDAVEWYRHLGYC